MPIYEYKCDSCSYRFEKKQGFHDEPAATCPKCQEMARRVFHPTPIIFKGSGFYVTDNRGNGGRDSDIEPEPRKEKSADTDKEKPKVAP